MKYKRNFKVILLLIVILFCFCFGIITLTYANTSLSSPDITITIDGNGQTTYTGNLFGNELWYPDMEVNGIIRIYNNYRTVTLKDLGVNVALKGYQSGFDPDSVYRSFLNNMKLTVSKGRFLVFDQPLFTERCFSQMPSYSGLPAGSPSGEEMNYNIPIPGRDTIDLKYTLHMDEQSGDELENLSATVNLELKLAEEISQE